MTLSNENINNLLIPEKIGVVKIKEFVSADELLNIQAEINDEKKIRWRDNHNTYINQRGLTIV